MNLEVDTRLAVRGLALFPRLSLVIASAWVADQASLRYANSHEKSLFCGPTNLPVLIPPRSSEALAGRLKNSSLESRRSRLGRARATPARRHTAGNRVFTDTQYEHHQHLFTMLGEQ